MIKLLNNDRRARIIFILIGITVVYFTWSNAQIVYNPLHITNISLRLAFRGIVTSIPMLIFLLCLYKPSKIIESIGLNRNILKGLGFAALCCSPLLIGMPIVGTLNRDLSFDYFFRMVVLAALFEEVVYRGFMFGQLFKSGKIGFIWAVIIPAILFGIGHLYQGHNLISSLMAFGVTALGAVYFSWVYLECNFNLWVNIGLHLFMNLCWTLLHVEGNETAVGALVPNILRVTAIVLTVILVIIYKKEKRPKNIRLFHCTNVISARLRDTQCIYC